MTHLKPRRHILPATVQEPRVRVYAVPLVVAVAVALLAAYFLQHFPATMLAFALVLLAFGRLSPVVRELVGTGPRTSSRPALTSPVSGYWRWQRHREQRESSRARSLHSFTVSAGKHG